MALKLEEKKAIVEQVAGVASTAHSAVAAEYRGLAVAEMTKLRSQAREAGVHVRVVPNNLAKRALSETSFSCLDKMLVGPIVLMFSQQDLGSAARLARDFSKDHEKLVVKALSIDGELMAASELNAIANLPTKDEAIALLMSVLKAPISKFVRTVAEQHAQVVRAMAAVRDQKQAN